MIGGLGRCGHRPLQIIFVPVQEIVFLDIKTDRILSVKSLKKDAV